MPKDNPDPRPWDCECENVLGVMHRNNSKVMVLDAFRARVAADQFKESVRTFTYREYAVIDLGFGKVPCVVCGRLNTWDASEQLFKQMVKRRKGRTFGLEGSL